MIFRYLSLILLLAGFLMGTAGAAEDPGDIQIFGMELEKLLNLSSGILAGALFAITFAAFSRTKRKRLLYVSAAFLLFAVKGFLTAHELFIEELHWVDPVASALNLAILLTFFAGLLNR